MLSTGFKFQVSSFRSQLGHKSAIHTINKGEQLALRLHSKIRVVLKKLLYYLEIFIRFKAASAIDQETSRFEPRRRPIQYLLLGMAQPGQLLRPQPPA
jgi:hypothetical protein